MPHLAAQTGMKNTAFAIKKTLPLHQEKVLIGHRIDNGVVYAVIPYAVFPIAGAMVRAADNESLSYFLKCPKKLAKFPVHVA